MDGYFVEFPRLLAMVEQNRSNKQGVLLFAEQINGNGASILLELHFHIRGVHMWSQKEFSLDQKYESWRGLVLADAIPFIPIVEYEDEKEEESSEVPNGLQEEEQEVEDPALGSAPEGL